MLPETRQVHCVSSKISGGSVKPRRRVSVCVRSAGKKRLDNRQLPLSAASTRVDIGAVRIGVKQRFHFLAAPEERNGLAFDRNLSPCARISSGPACPAFNYPHLAEWSEERTKCCVTGIDRDSLSGPIRGRSGADGRGRRHMV